MSQLPQYNGRYLMNNNKEKLRELMKKKKFWIKSTMNLQKKINHQAL